MFSAKDEVKFCCEKWNLTRTWGIGRSFTRNHPLEYQNMKNYAAVLAAVFSFLFNHRLKQSGRCL